MSDLLEYAPPAERRTRVTTATDPKPIIDLRSPETIFREMFAELVEHWKGDRDQAADQMRHKLRRERSRYYDLVVDFAVDQVQRQHRLTERKELARPAGRDRGLASLKSEADLLYEKWADWRLANGTTLIGATKAEILGQAAFHRAQGRTMMATAEWLTTIAQRMGDAETAGEALDARTIGVLREEAEQKWADR